MSDRAGELMVAIEAVLRAAPGLQALFAPKPVRIYDIPPTNAPFPYITLSDADDLELNAEGFDSGDVMVMIGCWSRTDPPGTAQAKALGAAVRTALRRPDVLDIMPDQKPGTVIPEAIRTITQPDGQTVQAVVKIEIAIDAITEEA